MGDLALDEARRDRRLAQGKGGDSIARHERPRVEERGEIDDVIVEGIGDLATLVGDLEELHIHAYVLPGRYDDLALRHHVGEFGQDLADG